MSVGTFDPNAGPASLDVDTVKALLAATEKAGVEALDAQQVQEFAPLITADWSEVASALASAEIESLIHVFTLGEAQYVAWTADAKSAVIPLVRELKNRGEYDKTMTTWIKAHTDNKFLPHGSLMDRL